MKIIDIHAHIYPDAIAQKAAQSIGTFYHHPISSDGTLGSLLAKNRQAGITLSLVHSVAAAWRRVQSINNYLMRTVAEHSDCLAGFGTLHPDHPAPQKELERIKAGGLLGIKLHPDIQQFPLDDPKALVLFRHMAELGMPLLAHIGDNRFSFSEPTRLARVMDAVPGLLVIGAHLGGWSIWQEGCRILAGRPGLWVDCSSSLFALTPQEAAEIIRRYGAERVFFGSDYPMWDPAEEVRRFLALPLTEEERALILHRNFEAFLQELG